MLNHVKASGAKFFTACFHATCQAHLGQPSVGAVHSFPPMLSGVPAQ